ncbi:hypothetical protein Vadar_024408 [Vaccinium darrowii]|uniref:Uncharacterized protein n=1 Tax=Vaccinium darrowii TaxID=229202 RepID=A0ACB7XCI4_9ERIC|nr:hypothetical protein Vadar_024408 [Vaccinium darrowii]
MDDLPLQKIQIFGPTFSSLLQHFSSSLADIDGLLFDHVNPLPTTTLSEKHPTPSFASFLPLIATVTHFFYSHSSSSFYSSSISHLHLPSLCNLVFSTYSFPLS